MSSRNSDSGSGLQIKVWDSNDEEIDHSSCDSCDLKIDLPESDFLDAKERGLKRKHAEMEGPDKEMMAVISGMEEEIERQLDAKAEKSNLTATNVKNILRTVITDEHVLAMVRQSLLGKYESKDLPYEPKITRAKAKEIERMKLDLGRTEGIPAKMSSASRCNVLIGQELPEDSSDEEYQPTEEQEQTDDDKEVEPTKEIDVESDKDSGKETEPASEKETDTDSESESDSESENGSSSEEGNEYEHDNSGSHSDNLCVGSDEELASETEESSSESEESDSDNDVAGVGNDLENESTGGVTDSVSVAPGKDIHDNQVEVDEECHKGLEESVPEKNSNNACSKLASDTTCVSLPVHSNHDVMHLADECTSTSAKEESTGNGSIGQRTRSKYSLSDTPLEAIERSFIPPDITTDMYDSECDDEDWKNFLKEFAEPLFPDMNNTVDDDEDADPEYNILADVEEEEMEEEKEDKKEECRVDRAVKVSKKEVNALVKELFKMAGVLSSDEDDDANSGRLQDSEVDLLESQNGTSTQDVYLTSEQRLLLDQQMREHVQFTIQNYLQTFYHPKYGIYAAECKSYLVNLYFLSGDNPKSAFHAGNLKAAFDLIDIWERYFSSEDKHNDLTRFIQAQINKRVWWKNVKKKAYEYVCQFPPKMMELVSNSSAFMYPMLLPPQPFRCDGLIRPCFVPAEEQLLVIGLEQFMDYARKNPEYFPKKLTYCNVTPYISKLMMPSKDPKQLYIYIYKHADDHPFKYYFEHHKAPGTIHYVLPYIPSMIRPPKDQPEELLPEIWRQYIFHKK